MNFTPLLMKKLIRIPLLFTGIILLFVAGKIAFLFYYHSLYSIFSSGDFIQLILHGLRHDASVAGYLSALPGLWLIVSVWSDHHLIHKVQKIYFYLVALLLASILLIDIILYEYWGFRLDSSFLFYLKSPKEALASTSVWLNISGFTIAILLSFVLYRYFNFLFYTIVNPETSNRKWTKKTGLSLLLLLQTALLFIPIRGGFKESTMNVGQVYFSNEILLNHAAVNPAFSLFESLSTPQQFDKQYKLLDKQEAEQLFTQLSETTPTDSIPSIFTLQRPNIVLVILESFMSLNMTELGGIPDVAVNLDSLAREGILLTNMYANSFRTDRALVSLLSAFPAQPTTSLMKYPRKLQRLPTLPGSLKKAGYDLEYLYGGDADFTSMRSYLKLCGFEKITEDVSFPRDYNNTKWGVPDHHVFNALYASLSHQREFPFMKVIQTQSSHNPFDVPFKSKHTDPYLNSVAYTDSCLGDFIGRFRQLSSWDSTVVVMIPDHAMRYPANLDNRSVNRYKIPMIIAGGAVKNALRIDTYASQTDLTATLLHQLNIDHSEFIFSRNILNSASPHFGFFTFKDGYGMVSAENEFVYDNESGTITTNTGKTGFNQQKAMAYIQKIYEVLSEL